MGVRKDEELDEEVIEVENFNRVVGERRIGGE